MVVGLAAAVEIMLPRSDFRRFVRLAMGLFVLLALTKPLIGLMQVPVTLPAGTVRAERSATGFEWREEDPGAGVPVSGSESLSSELVETQVAQLAAGSLGLAAGDVRVDVRLAGKAPGWPGAVQSIRLTVLRRPDAILTGCEGSAAEERLEQARLALTAQVAALYRLRRDLVQVIMPR